MLDSKKNNINNDYCIAYKGILEIIENSIFTEILLPGREIKRESETTVQILEFKMLLITIFVLFL